MALISGKDIGEAILASCQAETAALVARGIRPRLAVILVGGDPASAVYVRNKKKACERLGILPSDHELPGTTTQEELEALIARLNADPAVHGILCQFPLPKGLDEDRAILAIAPEKDVDGLHPVNAGYLCMGRPRFISCTPHGVLQLLKRSGVPTRGRRVVVLGRSNLVGRPVSVLLSLKGVDATVTLCHSRTENLAEVTRAADILVAAIGIPEYVTADMVGDGAVVIDVGINRVEDPSRANGFRLCGDVRFDEVAPKASLITPVPGGVGPMTIAMLMSNTLTAARLQNGLDPFEP